jgi:hypothetical protein
MCDRLLEWIDAGQRERRVDVAARLGPVFTWADRRGVVVPDGSVDSTMCEQCMSAHMAPIERIGPTFRSYCYRTGKRTPIEPTALEVVRPVPGAFGHVLASALNTKGRLFERSKDRLWELGWMDVEGRSRSVFFCRDIGLAENLSRITADLDARGSTWAGVVLCIGPTPAGVTTKHGHTFRPLKECAVFSGGDLSINVPLVMSWAQGRRRAKSNAISSEKVATPDWLEIAEQFWNELHESSHLNRNAKAMSRVVHEMLTHMTPPLKNPPELLTVYKYLLPLHRRHYPLERRRS